MRFQSRRTVKFAGGLGSSIHWQWLAGGYCLTPAGLNQTKTMNIFDARLAVSGGTLHHIGLMLAAEEHRCAWCQADGLRLPRSNDSHGICPRHKAEMVAELNHRGTEAQRIAA